MVSGYEMIPSGGIASAKGFLAGAVHAGMKTGHELDVAILYSEAPCAAAGVFTANQIKSAPVTTSQRHLASRRAQAIVANSGCANACVGEQGLADALEMAGLAAAKLKIPSEDVLVASTGVIGVPLPMDRVRFGIKEIELSREGGHDFARAIMTTDTKPKEIATQVDAGEFIIGGAAKGAGMIHPDLATMLCFITTDASVDASFLQSSLLKAVEISLNMISVDGDTSPSDCVFLLANGLAGNEMISFSNGDAFQEALDAVCVHLAKSIARDAEGATKLIEVTVEGAKEQRQARLAARTVASSPLVKAAIHGNDPNWGRIVAALGRSGAQLVAERLDVYLNNVCVMKQGCPMPFNREELRTALAKANDVPVRACLNLGSGKATAWGCDLSEEYVTINSQYTT
jgi:glutamate N-acetyltransferase/amino-acid N-acetyltransferase